MKENPSKTEPSNKLDTIATIFTRLISPITFSAIGLVVIYTQYINVNGKSAIPWLIAAAIAFSLALATHIVFMKIGWISNWDITSRQERPKLLAVVSICIILLTIATYILEYNTDAVFVLCILVFGLLVGSIITLFWKISFHTFTVTLVSLFIIMTFFQEYPFIWLLLVAPCITGWTRIRLRKHTVAQAIGGIVLGFLVLGVWWVVM